MLNFKKRKNSNSGLRTALLLQKYAEPFIRSGRLSYCASTPCEVKTEDKLSYYIYYGYPFKPSENNGFIVPR